MKEVTFINKKRPPIKGVSVRNLIIANFLTRTKKNAPEGENYFFDFIFKSITLSPFSEM